MPRDLRFALRRLARAPGFAAAAIVCLALGIGANTAIFSVINAVLLRPLPHAAPERLAVIWEASEFRESDRNTVSPANYQDWQSASRSFSGMAAIRRAVAELDPDLAVAGVSTLAERKAVSLARPRVNATVQRTRELGIRMALGAGGGALLRMVVREGMRPVLGGIVLGLAGALGGGRLLRSLLFGVGAGDPSTPVLVTCFLTTVALAAIYLPARRAARSDPMIALRVD